MMKPSVDFGGFATTLTSSVPVHWPARIAVVRQEPWVDLMLDEALRY